LNVQDAKCTAIPSRNAMNGWGKGLDPGSVREGEGEQSDLGESGSNFEDVHGVTAIIVPHRRHNQEGSVVCPEVWAVS